MAGIYIVQYKKRFSDKIKSRAPGDRNSATRGITAGCSEQTYPRHTSKTAYCCYRQVLTGFTAVRCTGPTLQRPLPFPYLTTLCLKPGIKPCYSGLQVQGTAGSPSGTANFIILFYCTHIVPKKRCVCYKLFLTIVYLNYISFLGSLAEN